MKKIKTERWHYRTWAPHLDELAAEQVDLVKDSLLIDKPLALMSDVHGGYTVPIGTVLVSDNYVMPEIIGPDIGCGIDNVVFKTNKRIDLDRLYTYIDKKGGSFYEGKTAFNDLLDTTFKEISHGKNDSIVRELKERLYSQFGTLGGGNHFIELQQVDGEKNAYSLMVHSGSRGAGGLIYNYYVEQFKKRAQDLDHKKEFTLYLSREEKLADNYINDVKRLCSYAAANREVIFTDIMEFIKSKFKVDVFPNLSACCTHNFIEEVAGELIYRKGANATSHPKLVNGELVYKPKTIVVAGSQGTPSFLCRGKKSAENAYFSCSHGAGRVLSRRQARRRLNLKDQMKLMKQAGVTNHRLKSTDFLDEAPGAYKNIQTVMKNQADLIEVLHELNPILNWKMRD